MRVLFYHGDDNGMGKLVQRADEILNSRDRIEVHNTIETFSRSVCLSKYDAIIAVIFAKDRNDLLDLLCIRDQLEDIRIILILPDRSKDIITKGHKLHPRFLSDADCDFPRMIAA